MPPTTRNRTDRCPGILRPWIADDGALLRIRTPAGRLRTDALRGLLDAAGRFGDGHVYVTSRANVQIRGVGDGLPQLASRIDELGLLPSPAHDRARNIMASPLTGRLGGRADVSLLARQLDALLLADSRLAELPGRFLFVLDDGRGDLIHRDLDLGLVAVDSEYGQLRVGTRRWGAHVRLDRAADVLVSLARTFLAVRGSGPNAPWHVDELDISDVDALASPRPQDRRAAAQSPAPPHGPLAQDDGRHCAHVPLPGGVLTSATGALADAGADVIMTPWRSLLLPDLNPRTASIPAQKGTDASASR